MLLVCVRSGFVVLFVGLRVWCWWFAIGPNWLFSLGGCWFQVLFLAYFDYLVWPCFMVDYSCCFTCGFV